MDWLMLVGVVLLIGGAVGLMLALNMDTTVATELYNVERNAFERVNNLGLMNQKQNYLIAAAAVLVVGTITTIFAKSRQ